jgi:hypothetical protein
MARDQDAARTARLFDRRTVERNIKKGLVTRKDYEKHLKSLADVAEKGVYGVDETDDADDALDAADEAADEADEGGDTAPADDDAADPGTNSQGH